MTAAGRGGPQPNHDPYDIAGAPTPPGGMPGAAPGMAVPGMTASTAGGPAFPEQYTEPVPSATGTWDPTAGPSAGVIASPPAPGESGTNRTPATKKHSRTGAAWVALVVAAIVMIFLLIFIVQNSDPVQVRYFGFEGTLSLGVAMLFAAIAGALTAGLLGTVRILQLRARARRATAG
ncbi:lipopolysaccharide assembly LapA domain-containing protein [Nakamurella sp.]|uniref:lipopolysaccharide assembly LapA domain-containing protein n=1 Tax=Nakamurella sp. TaxID=1869182 RepID=UPI0037834176